MVCTKAAGRLSCQGDSPLNSGLKFYLKMSFTKRSCYCKPNFMYQACMLYSIFLN